MVGGYQAESAYVSLMLKGCVPDSEPSRWLSASKDEDIRPMIVAADGLLIVTENEQEKGQRE